MRSVLLSSVLALSALSGCTGPVAPANTDFEAEDIMATRATSMGFRTTFDAPSGVWDFGLSAATTSGIITVAERHGDAVCDARLRIYVPLDDAPDDADGNAPVDADGDGYVEELYDCQTANPFFGDVLEGRDTEFISGSDAFWYSGGIAIDGIGPVEGGSPDDAFGASVALVDGYTTLAVGAPGYGESGAVHLYNYGTPYNGELTVEAAGIAADAGFGTKILGGDGIMVVEDTFARQFLYEIADGDDGLEATPMPIPDGGKVVAVHQTTLLVQPPVGNDLTFYDRTEDGWEANGTLIDAALPYTEWAFDEVAAFAVQPGSGPFRGFIDRYTRVDGQLDASLRMSLEHTGLDLSLEGETLVVAEALSSGTSGNGRVHVFDWSEDREQLVQEQYCPGGDDSAEPNGNALEAGPLGDGTFTIVEDDVDYYSITLQPGEQLDVTLTPEAGADIDLSIRDGDDGSLDSSMQVGDAVEDVTWANTSDEAVTVYVRAKAYSVEGCATYTLEHAVTAAPLPECDADFGNDTFETATFYAPGTVTMQSGSPVDYVDFGGVHPGQRVTATLSFDADLADLDLSLDTMDGEQLEFSYFDSPEVVTWTNDTGAHVDARLKVVWYAPPSVPECIDYDLDVALDFPPAEEEETDEDTGDTGLPSDE